MSYNQPRSDKNESTQYRKQGRPSNSSSGHRPNPSGSYVKGGGATGPAPSFSRRSQKPSNATGGPSKLNPTSAAPVTLPPVPVDPITASSTVSRNLQNGSNSVPAQPPWQGASATRAAVGASPQVETPQSSKSTSTFQPSSTSSDASSQATPKKSGDSSKTPFGFQFGTLSPGFMNGMQIPARTSSAPPNLDEQKGDQVNRKAAPSINLVPAHIPKQQPSKKDAAHGEKIRSGDSNPIPKAKKDSQGPIPPPTSQMQNPSLLPYPVPTIQVPFNQAPPPIQFSAANQQIQSQAIPASSIQMHVPLPVGLPLGNSPQVQQPMFVQNLQVPTHPMQPQSILHPGQGLSFTTPMGHQLPSLTNMGLGLNTQFPHQPGGSFTPQRKSSVKITDPKTREDIHLADGVSSGLRSHSNVPQSQPVPSYTPSHMNYYAPYGGGNLFFPGQGSITISSGQVAPPTSQPPRYPFAKAMDPSASVSHSVTKSSNVMQPVSEHDNRDLRSSSGMVQVTVKPPSVQGIDNSGKPPSDVRRSAEPVGAHKVSVASREDATLKETSLQSKQSFESVSSKSKIAAQQQSKGIPAEKATFDSLPCKVGEDAVTAQTSASIFSGQIPSTVETIDEPIMTKDNVKVEKKSLPSQDIGRAAISSTSSPLSLVNEIISEERPSDFMQSLPSNISSSVHSQDGPKTLTVEPSTLEADEQAVDAMSISSDTKVVGVLPIKESFSHHVTVAEESDTSFKQDELPCDLSDSSFLKHNEHSSDRSLEVVSSSGDEVLAKSKQLHVNPVTCDKTNERAIHDKEEKEEALEDVSSTVVKSDESVQHPAEVSVAELPVEMSKQEVEAVESAVEVSVSQSVKDKAAPDMNRSKTIASKMKKKRKEILQKADAAGTTSDLYMAYKGPEEKKDTTDSVPVADNSTLNIVEKLSADDDISDSKVTVTKTEPDDWEDAVDISASKLEESDVIQDDDINQNVAKKYSRDFLLKFSERNSHLPDGFEVTVDILDALNNKDLLPSPGRNMDRSNSGRMDRRGGNVADDMRWKNPGNFVPGRDLRVDVGFQGNPGFKPGQGGNYGVLRAPRPQTPQQYLGGILSGPMQSIPAQGQGRSSPDAERWQRASNYQLRGLIPSPQTPLQVMHKAEKKYEVGKASSEDEVKQRTLKSILNKLTPQNFDKLFEQVKAVNIDNAITLKGVISQIFDKALMEPTFCEMYANFCFHLAGDLPDFIENDVTVNFKRLLLTKCQEEFERGEREEQEANKADEDGEVQQTAEEREMKRLLARRRMLGNIRLIGELYKKRMLTERIMHECIKKLLGEYQNPDEENVEALCKLMSTIGEMIDHVKAKEHMDSYFDMMAMLSDNPKLSSRIRFMLKDAIDLRKNKWQQRRKVEGPKKIDDVHRDAANERSMQTSRLARTPSMGQSARRGIMDSGPRSSAMSSPSSSVGGGLRGMPAQTRGFGTQDARFEERQPYDGRALGPLPQRSLGDDSITLGPQGGLARGMSGRPPSTTTSQSSGFNGYSNTSEKSTLITKDEFHSRLASERYSGPSSHQSSNQEHNFNPDSRDLRNTGRALDTTSHSRASEKFSEEVLQEKSMAAIKEYYSARDEMEIALCIKDLKSPSFHPSMISLWLTDSFERKDFERDLLSNLLVKLSTSPQTTLISSQDLIGGFETVLTILEDSVNDAPKAAEFLGHVFGKSVAENITSLEVIGKLLLEGGEERGRLQEIGVAADVLGSILETIRVEKGDAMLNEFLSSSHLTIHDFLPKQPYRSRILEKFL